MKNYHEYSGGSVIVELLNLNLMDEFQILVQPIIAGKGLSLLNNIKDRIELKLLRTKALSSSGSLVFFYQPIRR
jgi:dihydrofolate reductase